MIQHCPPSPTPSYLLRFYDQFSTLYISYIFQLKLSWPLCNFVTHKNTKSHIIKTHNFCESIKSVETEKKKTISEANKFVGKCTVQQCLSFFFFCCFSFLTLQPDDEFTESLPVLSVWLIRYVRGRTRQVYKINPSSSRVLFQGGLKQKQKFHQEKKNVLHKIPFFEGV